MRSPAHGKGHEVKGPSRQRQVEPEGSLAKSARASVPKPESACLTALCFSPALLTLYGGAIPHHLSL